MQSISICCAADEAYAPGLAVLIRSVLEHCDPSFRVRAYIVDTELSETTKRKLIASWNGFPIDIEWMHLDLSPVQDLKVEKYFSTLTYARFLFPLELKREPKILFLDADLLVRADISTLWKTDLQGFAFGAVQDLGCRTVSEPKFGLRNYRALGLDPQQPYFNFGVVLIDTVAWNAEDITARAIAYAKEHPKDIQWPTQDPMNAITGGRWLALNPEWNSLIDALRQMDWSDDRVSPEVLKKFSADPKIVHYIGVLKPWQRDSRHPRRQEFLDVLSRTQFAL